MTNAADCFSQALLALFFKCRPAAGISILAVSHSSSYRGATSALSENMFPQTETTDTVRGHLIHFPFVF